MQRGHPARDVSSRDRRRRDHDLEVPLRGCLALVQQQALIIELIDGLHNDSSPGWRGKRV